MTLEEMAEEAYRTAESKGFCSNYEGNPDKVYKALALIHGEVSEAVDEYNLHGLKSYTVKDEQGNDKPEGVAIELADVILRVGNLCYALGIDIQEAVIRKNAYNKTRPWRHNKPGTGIG